MWKLVKNKFKVVLLYVKSAVDLKSKIVIFILLPYFAIRAFFARFGFHIKEGGFTKNKTVLLKYHNILIYNYLSSSIGSIVAPEEDLMRSMSIKEGIFIDIGAYVGKWALYVAKKLGNKGKVIAIEAHPSNYNLLCKNIKINKLQDNVLPINIVAWKKKGKSKLYLHGNPTHSTKVKSDKYIEVYADTIDNTVKKYNKEDLPIKLIKIDVEGAEYEVIQGAMGTIKKWKPRIIFEAWNENYFEKVKSLLEPLGYKFKKVDDVNYLAEI